MNNHPTDTKPEPLSPASGTPPAAGEAGAERPGPSPAVPSAAVQRFESCRWRKAAAAGTAAHCSHRDVKPMTGTDGFNPEAWCPDCAFFKLRRAPGRKDYDYCR